MSDHDFSAITPRLRETAQAIDLSVDTAVYEKFGRDPREPVLLGSGSLSADIGIFGRDPGATEVQFGEPFIGAGGQLVRSVLAQYFQAGGEVEPVSGAEGSIEDPLRREVGKRVFWANTVPYKPVGNKAWSLTVRRRFRPVIADVLEHRWAGSDLLTLGNNAFFWFGLDDRSIRKRLESYWEREDRYEAQIDVELGARTLRLYPLPHPSPLNARWYRRFPDLMRNQLFTAMQRTNCHAACW